MPYEIEFSAIEWDELALTAEDDARTDSDIYKVDHTIRGLERIALSRLADVVSVLEARVSVELRRREGKP